MKKSRSSVPLFADSCELGPAPPVRYEGLFATAGLPEPEPPAPPAPPFVAIAVGNTNEGASLPAKPLHCQSRRSSRSSVRIFTQLRKPRATANELKLAFPHFVERGQRITLVHDNGRGLRSHAGSMGAPPPGPEFQMGSEMRDAIFERDEGTDRNSGTLRTLYKAVTPVFNSCSKLCVWWCA
jgi:hypothetical protein